MVSIARTNDIDDELVQSVMNRYGLKTKREAVDSPLRRLVGEPLSLDDALAMEAQAEGDLEQMRADGPAEL